jgi:hypothetical protein
MNSSFNMFDILQIRSIEQAYLNVHNYDQIDYGILNDILAEQNNTQQETNREQNNQIDSAVLEFIDLDVTFDASILLAQPEQEQKQEEKQQQQQKQQENEINAYIELMDLHNKHITELRIAQNTQLIIYKKQHKRRIKNLRIKQLNEANYHTNNFFSQYRSVYEMREYTHLLFLIKKRYEKEYVHLRREFKIIYNQRKNKYRAEYEYLNQYYSVLNQLTVQRQQQLISSTQN